MKAILIISLTLVSVCSYGYPERWKAWAAQATSNVQAQAIVIAIARHESGDGTSRKYREMKNAHGLTSATKYMTFADPAESFRESSRRLENGKAYARARQQAVSSEDFIVRIAPIWCPLDASQWRRRVILFYREERAKMLKQERSCAVTECRRGCVLATLRGIREGGGTGETSQKLQCPVHG